MVHVSGQQVTIDGTLLYSRYVSRPQKSKAEKEHKTSFLGSKTLVGHVIRTKVD